ncbi:glycosyl transferases group 1 family protein [Methyloversatilis sp. RAC08]|uniref:glycosyltransferase family 4 protein n=1 Tax=Methyloversatilis sp. RAC08 TaxID=1842540 RepID=UPI00083E69F6|nr:glycosyltransferase family 4 protein [Methyloversatilis sp. RAC08]AOF83730.1 glycosyl transferases group 1 family protein [Methyloversatilis sp. RAC08]
MNSNTIRQDARYLVLTELFQPTKGGTAVWFDEVYRRLGGAGTHILTADVPGAAEHDRLSPNTVHRLALKRYPWIRPESLPVYLEFFLKTLAVGWRNPVTQIHAGRVLPEGLVAVRAGRLLKRPVVIYAHGEEITTWRQPRRVKAMKEAYCGADMVIANSDFTRGLLLDMGVTPGNVVIIHPGVDTERFRPGLDGSALRASLGLKPESLLILSVGRLTRRKGFDYVMQSVPELVARGLDVHHAVIGKGEDADYLADIRARSGMPERLHLLGGASAEDLPLWYAACDLFAMPNRDVGADTEGFGMVYIEAAACGRTSLAGSAGGTGAAVLDGKTGLRCNGNSLASVTAGLYQLLNQSTGFGAACAARAQERAHREFSWMAVMQRTEALCRKLDR